MGAVLVGEVASRFQLEGAVLDVEMPGHTSLDLVEDLRGVTVQETRVLDDHMGGQRRKVRGDGPDMKGVTALPTRGADSRA